MSPAVNESVIQSVFLFPGATVIAHFALLLPSSAAKIRTTTALQKLGLQRIA